MIKVVHMASNHQPFDTRIFLKECRTLAQHGYDVTFVVPHTRDEVRDGVRIRAVPIPKTRRERMLVTAWRVFRAALAEQADVYHFHDPELIPYALLIKFFRRTSKIIYDVHEDYPQQVLNKYWLFPFIRRSVAKVVAVFEAIAVKRFDGVVTATPTIHKRFDLQKTATICNFPTANKRVTESAASSYQERKPIACYIGNITQVRGIREMLDAIQMVNNHNPVTLTLAGRFIPSHLEQEALNHPGWQYVTYKGWLSQEKILQLLSQSRVGLVTLHPIPNYIDALPVKLFEYMLAGIPVIASDFPLWREIIEGAECGVLVNPLDPQAIAEAVCWILAHPKEAQAMGQNGQKAVLERYNWSAESQKLVQLYERLSA